MLTLVSFCAASSTMRLPSALWRRMGWRCRERAACCHMLHNCRRRVKDLAVAIDVCLVGSPKISIQSSPAAAAARHHWPSTPNARPSALQRRQRVAGRGSAHEKFKVWLLESSLRLSLFMHSCYRYHYRHHYRYNHYRHCHFRYFYHCRYHHHQNLQFRCFLLFSTHNVANVR